MANFTTTDRGVEQGAIRIELDANGEPRSARVEIAMVDGSSKFVQLSRTEAAALLTPGERAAFQSGMPKLYAGAVAKAGGS
jgi:hypothetical protein